MQADSDWIGPTSDRVGNDRAHRQYPDQLPQPAHRRADPRQHQVKGHYSDQTTVDTHRHQRSQRHVVTLDEL